jgi:hypothetical protein
MTDKFINSGSCRRMEQGTCQLCANRKVVLVMKRFLDKVLNGARSSESVNELESQILRLNEVIILNSCKCNHHYRRWTTAQKRGFGSKDDSAAFQLASFIGKAITTVK